MKTIFLFTFLVSTPLFIHAQREKARPLLADDPIVGCWKYMDSGDLPSIMFDGDQVQYLWLSAGSKTTVAARSYDEAGNNLISTSNFVAYSDGTMIYGKIYKSYDKSYEGKEVQIRYTYKKGKDRLILTHNNQSYTFERIDPLTMKHTGNP